MPIGPTHYFVLSAVLLACGLLAILLKRNAIGMLMGVELVLNAATLNLVTVNRYWHALAPDGRPAVDGQVFALFIIVLAAAEAAVALAIFLNYYKTFGTVDVERADTLKS